jgi:hypothetical protein
MSDALKYAFLADRDTLFRVLEFSAGIRAIPARAPNAPHAIMFLEPFRIIQPLPFGLLAFIFSIYIVFFGTY